MSAEETANTDKLIAELMGLLDQFPGGYQVTLGIRLGKSIDAVDQMFTKHDLPWRTKLLAELNLWRSHAEEGARIMEHSYRIMREVIGSIEPTDRH